MPSMLNDAIIIAVKAHAGQVDKAGQPYILHPLRVMLAQDTDEARIAAVLHDVVEDCPDWPMARLIETGFPSNIIDAIDSVTRRADESYEQFIERAGRNRIGLGVKIADLIDNLDATRLPSIAPRDQERLDRYEAALDRLRSQRDLHAGLDAIAKPKD
jgi:(p)ppGpp synthase/HD superfamily hydrolase